MRPARLLALGLLLCPTACVDPEPAAAPAPEAPAPAPKKKKAAGPAGLKKPAPKPCVAPPSGVDGEAGMAASEGLEPAEAGRALNTFAPQVLTCLGDASPTGTLHLRLVVACSGVVDSVKVVDRGDWPAEVASCVAERVGYAELPAHGLPDGDTVDWPLRYSAP